MGETTFCIRPKLGVHGDGELPCPGEISSPQCNSAYNTGPHLYIFLLSSKISVQLHVKYLIIVYSQTSSVQQVSGATSTWLGTSNR